MIRSVKILLNNKFSGSTEAKNSNNFVLLNGQYVHVQYLGGGVVDQHNVRTFLNDENNALIINNFVSYIQQTYSNEESQTILYDDIMLSDVFNDFYNSTILSGTSSDQNGVIQGIFTGSTYIIQNDWRFQWNGYQQETGMMYYPTTVYGSDRIYSLEEKYLYQSEDDSYYTEINLNINRNLISEEKFLCKDKIFYEDPDEVILIDYARRSNSIIDKVSKKISEYLSECILDENDIFCRAFCDISYTRYSSMQDSQILEHFPNVDSINRENIYLFLRQLLPIESIPFEITNTETTSKNGAI